MKIIRKLAASLCLSTLFVGGIGSVSVQATNELNDGLFENSDEELSEFSFASKSTLNSDADIIQSTYEEYYTSYGFNKASNTIIDELYITLDKTLTYALRDEARKSYSFSQAWSSSKDEGSFFEGAFTELDESGKKINYYNKIYQFYRSNKNSDGYARVTEDIVPALQFIAKHLKTLQSEDSWPALCYYKPMDTTGTKNPFEGDASIGEQRLVYGNKDLKDEDAFVLLIMGDGFVHDERESLYEKGAEFANYLMETSPFSEFKDSIKIYAMSVDSNESGVSRDTESYDKADDFMKDTYFGTSFWCGGMQRLVSVSALGLLRLNKLMRYVAPNADYAGLLVNSERYGGSGGTYCTCSLNESAKEIFIHEIAHTIADLADEYYAGNSYFGTHPNMSNQKKTENLPWADFYGLDGVSKYAYVDDLTEEVITYGGSTWYKPCDKTCKMEILWDLKDDGSQEPVPFCPVCSEALRKAICRDSNITSIFYQPYNRIFKDDGYAYKLSDPNVGFDYSILDYVLLRKGNNEAALSSLSSSLYTVTIKDALGNLVEAAKSVGVYTVSIEFIGDATYDAINLSFTFEIVSFVKEKGFISCVDDIIATEDYSEKYTLINEALELYKTVNQSDSSVVEAKATLDSIISDFNTLVDEMNQDSVASISIASNMIFTISQTILLSAILCYVIKKALGGKY